MLEVDAVMRGDFNVWADIREKWKLVSEPVPGIVDEALLTDNILLVRAKNVLLFIFAAPDIYKDSGTRSRVLKTIGQKAVSHL